MIVESIISNIRDLEPHDLKQRHQEKVYLESAQLLKRVQRVKTDHGRELGIRLKQSKDLEVGDILFMDQENIIFIDVLSDDLLVIQPRSMQEMGDIAHQLGNRHLPAQFEGDEMLVQYDYLVDELLQQLDIPHKREKRKVQRAFRHIGHHHD